MRAATLPSTLALRATLPTWRRLVGGEVLLALAMAALLVAVPPGGEFPVDIDWNYARVVQGVVERGQLEISPWTASSLVLQVYWGALFAKLFGFSHTVLRVSTLVLAAAAVVAFYLLLRRLLTPQQALFGALLLLFNPLFVVLAYSFKTDVPFLALALWSLYCYVRGWPRRRRDPATAADRPARAAPGPAPRLGWIVAGSTLAGAAYLVRQLGVMLPLALLCGLLLADGWRPALRPRLLAATLGPFLPFVLLGQYFVGQRGPVRQESVRWMLDFWARHDLGMAGVLLDRFAETVATLGLFTLPLALAARAGWSALGSTRRQRRLIGGLVAAVLVGFVVRFDIFGESPLFLALGQVLSPHGFRAAAEDFYGSPPTAIDIPDGVLILLTAACALGGLLLVTCAVALASRRALRGPAGVPLLFGLLAAGLTLPYYAFYEDYLLPLLPSALLAVAVALRRVRWQPGLALAGVALLVAWSVWWEREYLDRLATVWAAGQAVVALGVPADEIDGGFEWNGWHRGQAAIARAVARANGRPIGRRLQTYVWKELHPEHPRYVLAFAPPEPSDDKSIPSAVLQARGQRVYVLERLP